MSKNPGLFETPGSQSAQYSAGQDVAQSQAGRRFGASLLRRHVAPPKD